MKTLVKDKKIRDFYLELSRDYMELDARLKAEADKTAAAASTEKPEKAEESQEKTSPETVA
jgi:hypothetical protein